MPANQPYLGGLNRNDPNKRIGEVDYSPYATAKQSVTRLAVGRTAEATKVGSGILERQGLGDVPGIRASIAGRTNVRMQETLGKQISDIDMKYADVKQRQTQFDQQMAQRRKELDAAKKAARSAGTYSLIGDAIKVAMLFTPFAAVAAASLAADVYGNLTGKE